jgi:hypothetical protein
MAWAEDCEQMDCADSSGRRDLPCSASKSVLKGAAIVRIINGCEVDWASGHVFAVPQDHPTYGYLFAVCADRK